MASVKSRADKVLKICGVQDKTYRNGIVNTAKALLKMDNVEIIAHRAPDGDTLGSAYALCRGMRSLGKKANVVCADNIPEKYAFMQADMESQSFEPAHFVSVDIAAPHLMGKLSEAYENKIEICIDHHMGNSINAPMKLVEEDAAATGEIIWILLEAMGAQIEKATASCLFAAISFMVIPHSTPLMLLGMEATPSVSSGAAWVCSIMSEVMVIMAHLSSQQNSKVESAIFLSSIFALDSSSISLKFRSAHSI